MKINKRIKNRNNMNNNKNKIIKELNRKEIINFNAFSSKQAVNSFSNRCYLNLAEKKNI